MKIKLISTSADDGKLKEEYIKAFNAKESKTEDDYGDQIYTYEVAVSSVEKLFEIAKKINQELIISSKGEFGPNIIEIYDGYREWTWKSQFTMVFGMAVLGMWKLFVRGYGLNEFKAT